MQNDIETFNAQTIGLKEPGFCHLHTHTEWSLLDGSNKVKEYVKRVKELAWTARRSPITASCTA